MNLPRRSRVALSILVAACGLGSMLVVSRAGASAGSSPAGRAVAECRSRNLVGFSLGQGAAAGNLSNIIGIMNRGTSSCRLGGYPGLVGTRLGHGYPLVAGRGTFFGDLSPTVLASREVGALILGTEDGCPAINQPNNLAAQRAEIAAHSYSGLIIELPLHDGFVRVDNVHFDTACTLESSRLGWVDWLLSK